MGEDGKFLFHAVPTTGWRSPETLEHWREAWAAMTNAPSMTITSTIPTPEGSDSTSREGKTILLPVTAGGNAPPALVQKIGNTTYKVSFHFSITRRETMSGKINRFIRRKLDAS